MFLKINDEYAIESDANCWAISNLKKELKKGEFWKPIAWYSTLEGAVNGLLQREIRCLEVDSLSEAIKGVSRLSEELVGALTPKYTIKLKKEKKK